MPLFPFLLLLFSSPPPLASCQRWWHRPARPVAASRSPLRVTSPRCRLRSRCAGGGCGGARLPSCVRCLSAALVSSSGRAARFRPPVKAHLGKLRQQHVDAHL